jgi:hypothetical protein
VAEELVTYAAFDLYTRSETTTDATIKHAALDAAHTATWNALGRKIVVATTATARVYMPTCGSFLFIDDCTAITSVVANGATLTSGTDYQAEPLNSLSYGGETVPFHVLRKLGYYYNRWDNYYSVPGAANITVTATWGWAAIPPQVAEMCKLIGKAYLESRDFALGVVALTEGGAFGARETKLVMDAIRDYSHPRAIATP